MDEPQDMCEDGGTTFGMMSRASRETAKVRVQRLIDDTRRRLSGLEQLLRVAEKTETGSPLEELIWKLTQSLR